MPNIRVDDLLEDNEWGDEVDLQLYRLQPRQWERGGARVGSGGGARSPPTWKGGSMPLTYVLHRLMAYWRATTLQSPTLKHSPARLPYHSFKWTEVSCWIACAYVWLHGACELAHVLRRTADVLVQFLAVFLWFDLLYRIGAVLKRLRTRC